MHYFRARTRANPGRLVAPSPASIQTPAQTRHAPEHVAPNPLFSAHRSAQEPAPAGTLPPSPAPLPHACSGNSLSFPQPHQEFPQRPARIPSEIPSVSLSKPGKTFSLINSLSSGNSPCAHRASGHPAAPGRTPPNSRYFPERTQNSRSAQQEFPQDFPVIPVKPRKKVFPQKFPQNRELRRRGRTALHRPQPSVEQGRAPGVLSAPFPLPPGAVRDLDRHGATRVSRARTSARGAARSAGSQG